jgi:prevent-host-death family protein
MPKSITVNIYEAKTRLSELVELAASGDEVVIAKAGKPRVRLVAVNAAPARRPGGWEGRLWISEDFDAPLPAEVQRSFSGESE